MLRPQRPKRATIADAFASRRADAAEVVAPAPAALATGSPQPQQRDADTQPPSAAPSHSPLPSPQPCLAPQGVDDSICGVGGGAPPRAVPGGALGERSRDNPPESGSAGQRVAPQLAGVAPQAAAEVQPLTPSAPVFENRVGELLTATAEPLPGEHDASAVAADPPELAAAPLVWGGRRKRVTVAETLVAKLESRARPVAVPSAQACTDGQPASTPAPADAPQPGSAGRHAPAVEPAPFARVPVAEDPAAKSLESSMQCTLVTPSAPREGAKCPASPPKAGGVNRDLEFELWVETDLQASWCLEDNGGDNDGQWRGHCSTASLRRRWEEFEALGHSGALGACDLSLGEALELLGLPDDLPAPPSAAQLASAFRTQSRTCHPDKVGPSAAFDALVAAYQVAQKALLPKQR